MAEDGAMELDSEENSTIHTGNVKKNIAIKLKTANKSGRGPGRPRKGSKAKKEVIVQERADSVISEDLPVQPDLQLQQTEEELIEAPIFKQPVEPMHQNQRLLWNHKVNLIGEKVVDPLIHCCEKCCLPILIYGRMIPCKHVFCFDCARKTEKTCARCEEPVQRIEQSALGTVFICTHGGPKHGAGGCRRTYLSQRDLQAHVYHRHLRTDVPSSSSSKSTVSPSSNQAISSQPQTSIEKYSTSKTSSKLHTGSVIEQYTTAAGRHGVGEGHMGLPPPRSLPGDSVYQQQTLLTQMPPPAQSLPSQPPMMQGPPPRMPLPQSQPPTQQNVGSQDAYQMSNLGLMPPGRTNLITVPLQDDTDYRRRDLQQGGYMQAGGIPPVSYSTSMPPPGNLPPPQQGYPSSMAPALHQGPPPTSFTNPPPTGPPPFSSPPMANQMPVSSSNPISHPPPGSVPAPNLATPPPPLHSGPRMALQPPRFGSPQGHYEDSTHNYGQPPPGGQTQRAPWTGPPQRGPPPRPGAGPMHPPPQRPQSDYGQYYQ